MTVGGIVSLTFSVVYAAVFELAVVICSLNEALVRNMRKGREIFNKNTSEKKMIKI